MSTSPSDSTSVYITPTSLEDAARKLDALYQANDAHPMYTKRFSTSRSNTSDGLGMVEDRYNMLKTLMGQLIDGSRKYLRSASKEYSDADDTAAGQFDPASVVNGGTPR